MAQHEQEYIYVLNHVTSAVLLLVKCMYDTQILRAEKAKHLVFDRPY